MSLGIRLTREPYGTLRQKTASLGRETVLEIKRTEDRVSVFVYRGVGESLHASIRTPDTKACFRLVPSHCEDVPEIEDMVQPSVIAKLIEAARVPFTQARGHKETIFA